VRPAEVRVGPTGFLLGAAGVAANFAGGWLWLGLGPALFVVGALTVALSWASVAVFLWVVLRESTLAQRLAEQHRDD
jgi:hypothetical protein